MTNECVTYDPEEQEKEEDRWRRAGDILGSNSFHAIIAVILMVSHSLGLSGSCPEPFHSGS